MSKSYGITPAYLAWKRAGSPGSVWCTPCDCPADENQVHKGMSPEPEMLAWRRRIEPDGRGTAKTEGDPLDRVQVALGGNKVYPVTPELQAWTPERVRKLKAGGALQIREDDGVCKILIALAV
jgi:hypothetical protein